MTNTIEFGSALLAECEALTGLLSVCSGQEIKMLTSFEDLKKAIAAFNSSSPVKFVDMQTVCDDGMCLQLELHFDYPITPTAMLRLIVGIDKTNSALFVHPHEDEDTGEQVVFGMFTNETVGLPENAIEDCIEEYAHVMMWIFILKMTKELQLNASDGVQAERAAMEQRLQGILTQHEQRIAELGDKAELYKASPGRVQ